MPGWKRAIGGFRGEGHPFAEDTDTIISVCQLILISFAWCFSLAEKRIGEYDEPGCCVLCCRWDPTRCFASNLLRVVVVDLRGNFTLHA